MKKGQILLTTLLVLSILSILTVSIASIATRDIFQVGNTDKYEQTYNSIDTRLRNLIALYNASAIDYAGTFCSDGTKSQTVVSGRIEYTCTKNDTSFSEFAVKDDVVITDYTEVNNYPVKKDESLEIILNGYNGIIESSWDIPAAIEYTLVFRNNANEVTVLKDIYQNSTSVFQSAPGSVITFVPDASTPGLKNTFTISSTSLFQGTTISLILTPRINTSDSVNITVKGGVGFPAQMREFRAIGVSTSATSAPVVKLSVFLPLSGQIGNFLDYALISPNNIQI